MLAGRMGVEMPILAASARTVSGPAWFGSMGTALPAVSEALVWTNTANTSATAPSTSNRAAIRRRLLNTSSRFDLRASRSSTKLPAGVPVRRAVAPDFRVLPGVRLGFGVSGRPPTCWALCVSNPLILGGDYTEGYPKCKLARRPLWDWYISGYTQRIGVRLSARRLVVSTYLQYIALALGVVLLVAFVRQ